MSTARGHASARGPSSWRYAAIALGLGLSAIVSLETARADEALTVSASLSDERVAVGDVVTLEVSVVSHLEEAIELSFPSFDGLSELSRSKSEGTSIQWSGAGQVITKEYTITLDLQVEKGGRLIIPPIVARAGRVKGESRPLTLSVGASAESAAAVAAEPGQVAPPAPGEERLFVRYRVDRAQAYVGEQIILDLDVYALSSLNFGIEEAAPPPSLDGFWKEVIDQPQRLTRRIESVAGRSYHVYRVWRVALFPLEAGERTIPAAQLTFAINRSIFGDGQRDRRRAPAVKVEALALPAEGRPEGFSSQNVGTYELSAALDREKVPAGKALVLSLRVTGRGNIKNVRLPELREIPGFRVFSPTVTDKVDITGDGIGGEKRADFLLMPERGGRLEIPPIELVIFDPAEKRYTRLATSSLRVVVEGEPVAGAGPAAPAPAAAFEPVAPVSVGPGPREGLRPLRFRSTLGARRPSPLETPLYPGLVAAPPLLFLLYLGGESLRSRAQRKLSSRQRQRAKAGEARARLESARAAAQRGDVARAFREAQEALLSMASDRSGVPLRGLTIEEARAALDRRGAGPGLVDAFARELELADYARFAAGRIDRTALTTAAERWEGLMSDLESWTPSEEEGES